MYKQIITLSLTFLFAFNLLGQNAINDLDSLILQARSDSDRIQINWYPTTPEIWKDQLVDGYTIQRSEVDESGNTLGTAIPMGSNPILPQDSAWMVKNSHLADGLLEPIMALMYDSTFMFPENDYLDETEMKYNYIVYESTRSVEIASAVGLGFVDSLVVEGKRYRYTILGGGTKNQLVGEVDITTENRANAQSSNKSSVEFTFPNDLSLSDMLAAANPRAYNTIQAIAKPYGDSIVIRWGPSTPRLWQSAMKDGYKVYRHKSGEKAELLQEVFPWSRSEITKAISHDSFAMMAAGILYNDDSVNAEEDAGLFDKAAEFENNFGFSLYAAERSGLAADILGLRYVDKNVESGVGYTYLIASDDVDSELLWGKVDLINSYTPDPKPVNFKSESQEKMIKLTWDKENNESKFSAYTIERSTDDVNYELLTKTPLVFSDNDRYPLEVFSYTDSVGVNGKPFYYRLKGYNSFGELSEAADVSGEARDFTPPPPVTITEAVFDDSLNIFEIKWVDIEQVSDFENYQVLMSDMPNGLYSSISPPLSIEVREFSFRTGQLHIDRAFYFKVQSMDKMGNISTSANKNCLVPDLVAPDPPTVLTGIIDSTGLVKVAWEHSTAKDLTGYWLYWGNDPNQEMSLVNDDLLNINSHSWYIDDVSLNEKLYFCVRTQDDAYNRGNASVITEISRPDKVPPTSPFLLSAFAEKGQIEITWKPSLSEDVMGQILYKRPVSSSDSLWQIIDTLTTAQKTFVDKDIQIDQPYQYCITSYDDAGNMSDYSNHKTGKVPFPQEEVVISDLRAKLQKDKGIKRNSLTWEYKPLNEQIANEPYVFMVYRAIGGGNPKFLKSISADSPTFKDTEVVDGVLYNYAVKVKYENGWTGGMSDIKSILVK